MGCYTPPIFIFIVSYSLILKSLKMLFSFAFILFISYLLSYYNYAYIQNQCLFTFLNITYYFPVFNNVTKHYIERHLSLFKQQLALYQVLVQNKLPYSKLWGSKLFFPEDIKEQVIFLPNLFCNHNIHTMLVRNSAA